MRYDKDSRTVSGEYRGHNVEVSISGDIRADGLLRTAELDEIRGLAAEEFLAQKQVLRKVGAWEDLKHWAAIHEKSGPVRKEETPLRPIRRPGEPS